MQSVEDISQVIGEITLSKHSASSSIYIRIIINKYGIADPETLKELICLLTSTESVDIQMADIDDEAECFDNVIYHTVSGEIYSI